MIISQRLSYIQRGKRLEQIQQLFNLEDQISPEALATDTYNSLN